MDIDTMNWLTLQQQQANAPVNAASQTAQGNFAIAQQNAQAAIQQEMIRQQTQAQQNAIQQQIAAMNNSNALSVAGINNQSNNTLAGMAKQKLDLGLNLLGLLGGGQGGVGGQSAANLGPRPGLPAIVGQDMSGRPATAANIQANQQWAASQNAFSAALAAQQAWDQQNAARQTPQGGGRGLGGLGQAVAGSGLSGGLGGDAQQLLALGLIDPQIASTMSQQNIAAMNNASQLGIARLGNQNNLDVTRLTGQNQLANTGLQNQGQQQIAGINNAAQMQQLLAQITGQKEIAGLNNANQLANTRLQNQGQLANIGAQTQGNLQLAGVNNASQLQQLLAQIESQQRIAEGGWQNTLANTGLQTRGALDLASVNNAADLDQLMRSLTSQERIAGLNNRNALDVAGINTAPALQAQQLARDQFQNRNNLLTQILGASGGINGLFAADTGVSPLSVAQGGANNGDVSSQYLQQLIAGADDQFTAMPQELFQQQLNQILGNSASALGGQLRSAQASAGGAGMGANSPVARALQNQFGNAANASTQNSLTNAFLGKYNTDFQRQQAQAGYRQGLGQLALGQTTQNQNYGLGLGNLQLGSLQNSTTRRGQNMGLIGQLTA